MKSACDTKERLNHSKQEYKISQVDGMKRFIILKMNGSNSQQ
jgi:hypothetical protein